MVFFGWRVRLGASRLVCDMDMDRSTDWTKRYHQAFLSIKASRNGHWIILAFLYYSPAGDMHHRVSLLIIISYNFLSSFYLFIYQPL